jgi:two-component system response regulator
LREYAGKVNNIHIHSDLYRCIFAYTNASFNYFLINPMTGEHIEKHPTIFIADDDDDDVYFVRSALRELDKDIDLKHFKNGKTLLVGLNTCLSLPNFVILDLNMPVLDGRETLRQIRKTINANDLPVIILSTSNHNHEKEVCFEYGANSYFTKPYSYNMYLEIIKKLKTKWIDRVKV